MNSDRAYLLHIQEAIRRIRNYTSQGEKAFLDDPKTQDAVIRQLEILGEAVKKLSATSKKQHTEIPWKQIAGMRDKMIHEYFGVDLHLVWDVVARNLSGLEQAVHSLLK